MADLVLKLDELVQLRDDLDAVVREFQNADDFSDQVAEATGHDSLHDHVRDFAHKWNEKRKEMTENVKNVQQVIAAVADNFVKVDGEGLRNGYVNLVRSWPYSPGSEDWMKIWASAVTPEVYAQLENPDSWYAYYTPPESGV